MKESCEISRVDLLWVPEERLAAFGFESAVLWKLRVNGLRPMNVPIWASIVSGTQGSVDSFQQDNIFGKYSNNLQPFVSLVNICP